MRNPALGNYFRRDDNIRNKGCVDSIKWQGNARLVSINVHGNSPTNERKIQHLREAVQKYYTDTFLVYEVNIK